MQLTGWTVRTPGTAMVLEPRVEAPGPGEVVVRVAGCGVCHTDLGFYYDGIPTRHPFPLTLGHEISGTVVETGAGTEAWSGRDVVVPAVIPCGRCDACHDGRGSVCTKQIFPGCDVHGGFATHVRVPAAGLCAVPDLDDPRENPGRLPLWSLAVVADAVSTPYQAISRSGLEAGDLAVFVGCGGIGGFGVQIAAALGASVAAIDVDAAKLLTIGKHGADLAIDATGRDAKQIRKAIRAFAEERAVPTWRTRIFETSGTTAGQATAFGLLGHGGWLGIVGYTPETVELRLSNVMALDATVQGNWGCLPEHYPKVVDLVLSGKVALPPFIERRPLGSINHVFEEIRAHRVERRVILVPEA